MSYELSSRKEALEVISDLEAKIKELETENAKLKASLKSAEARSVLTQAEKEFEEVETKQSEAERLAAIERTVKEHLGVQ